MIEEAELDFRNYDIDGDGLITLNEMNQIMGTDQESERIEFLNFVDTNKDGSIDL